MVKLYKMIHCSKQNKQTGIIYTNMNVKSPINVKPSTNVKQLSIELPEYCDYSLPKDNRILYNISAMTQPDSLFNGWFFNCYKCLQKTSNIYVVDSKYELYICKQCISKRSPDDLDNLYYNATKYCRKIAHTKINIV